jgi:alkylation response protein AidB-like acyl-CoA dehydrogenase
MTWPRLYGGHERSALERYVLLEELLAAGAPAGAHWIADRQSGPTLLKYGTEAQKQTYLPGMASGKIFCCIGMSEPGAGSDLASVRTRAERIADGRWQINGQKIWTTNAHRSSLMIALIRTSPPGEKRQSGLSQFLIDIPSPGVTVRPIADLLGHHPFCEVFFDNAILEPQALLGTEGDGWAQVTSELSLERSGPERYLSSFMLFSELLRIAGARPDDSTLQFIGRTAAELWTLRQMSISIAAQLERGEDPALEAAIVKDLGNQFEQSLPERIQALVDEDPYLEENPRFTETLGLLLQAAPAFSLRGGTREILRGIIARGLGLR